MSWIHPLSAEVDETAEAIGGKAHGLVALRRLGLPVPAGFVIGTSACRAFRRDGRLPAGLHAELAAALAGLEAATNRKFGGLERPLVVSVRSGGCVAMPGMMSTVLDLGLTAETASALAAETTDTRFALDSRLRFLSTFASALTGLDMEAAHPATGRRGGTARRGAAIGVGDRGGVLVVGHAAREDLPRIARHTARPRYRRDRAGDGVRES